MKSIGLEWPLDHVKFENFHCATLNRANAVKVVLVTNKPAYAYFNESSRAQEFKGLRSG